VSELLPEDNPQAYIPGDRRRALARGEDLPLLAHGAAVFVDMFPPTEAALAAALGGQRAPQVQHAGPASIVAGPDEHRLGLAGSTYVVIAGGDEVIPFFRSPTSPDWGWRASSSRRSTPTRRRAPA